MGKGYAILRQQTACPASARAVIPHIVTITAGASAAGYDKDVRIRRNIGLVIKYKAILACFSEYMYFIE
jgi:hypothetical protein